MEHNRNIQSYNSRQQLGNIFDNFKFYKPEHFSNRNI